MKNILEQTPSPMRTIRLAWLFVATVLLAGCGPSGPAYWPIRGKVSFQGKPVTRAQIRFCNSKDGIDIFESLNDNGEYTIVTGKKKGSARGKISNSRRAQARLQPSEAWPRRFTHSVDHGRLWQSEIRRTFRRNTTSRPPAG